MAFISLIYFIVRPRDTPTARVGAHQMDSTGARVVSNPSAASRMHALDIWAFFAGKQGGRIRAAPEAPKECSAIHVLTMRYTSVGTSTAGCCCLPGIFQRVVILIRGQGCFIYTLLVGPPRGQWRAGSRPRSAADCCRAARHFTAPLAAPPPARAPACIARPAYVTSPAPRHPRPALARRSPH